MRLGNIGRADRLTDFFLIGMEMPSENALKDCQDVACIPAAYVSTIFTLWDILRTP